MLRLVSGPMTEFTPRLDSRVHRPCTYILQACSTLAFGEANAQLPCGSIHCPRTSLDKRDQPTRVDFIQFTTYHDPEFTP